MKKAIIATAASLLVAGCISTDMGTAAKTAAPADGVNHERGTGSNISRREKEARTAMDREEIDKLQRPGGSNQIGKSGGR